MIKVVPNHFNLKWLLLLVFVFDLDVESLRQYVEEQLTVFSREETQLLLHDVLYEFFHIFGYKFFIIYDFIAFIIEYLEDFLGFIVNWFLDDIYNVLWQ